jgi:hypothetical protein
MTANAEETDEQRKEAALVARIIDADLPHVGPPMRNCIHSIDLDAEAMGYDRDATVVITIMEGRVVD